MKRSPIFLLILLLCLLGCMPATDDLASANQLIETQVKHFVPDKRVAILKAEAKPKGSAIALVGETSLPEAKDSILAALANAGYTVQDSMELLPEAQLEDRTFGIVRLSVCNIRSEPGDSEELSTQATLGTPITIYKKKGNWFYIQTPDGYLGWLYKGGFSWMDKQAFDNWQKGERLVYLPEFGFSYAQPDINGPVVSDLFAGNILLKAGESGDFTKVEYPDGRSAFVPNGTVIPIEEWLATHQPTAENILQTAQRWMGRPYLWGGTSGKGADCSGFTKSVFFLNGLMLPRDASQQVHCGIAIETDTTLKNLQAGDFLFFGQAATAEKKERIRHVAIYMGEGKIIHSAELVKIESLIRGEPNFAEDRLNTLIRAKRMLASPGENGVLSLKDLPAYSSR